MVLTINKILNMADSIPEQSGYEYNQYSGIGGKSYIAPCNESLKKISLNIKLHHMICNPDEAIKIAEDFASNNKEIDWFQEGKYQGRYVITSINKVILQKFKDMTAYAELSLELLESPYNIEEFNPAKAEALENIEPARPSLVQKIKDAAKQTVKDSVFTAIQTVSIDNVSDIGNIVAGELQQGIINKIEQAGISGIYDYVSDAVDKIDLYNDLTKNEKIIISDAISSIPGKMIDAVLH